jgi:hypothetical protein
VLQQRRLTDASLTVHHKCRASTSPDASQEVVEGFALVAPSEETFRRRATCHHVP